MDALEQQKSVAEIRRKIAKQADTETSLQKNRTEQGYNKWRDFDLMTCLIALTSLLLALVDYVYTFDKLLVAFPNPD